MKKPSGSSNLFPVKPHVLEKTFFKLGFKFDRQRGSHRIYYQVNNPVPVVIPFHSSKDIPVPLIHDNLKRTGISKEEFLNALYEILK